MSTKPRQRFERVCSATQNLGPGEFSEVSEGREALRTAGLETGATIFGDLWEMRARDSEAGYT